MPTAGNLNRFERHRTLTLFVIVTSAVFGTLILAEILAARFLPSTIPTRAERINFWRYDSLLGWSHEPHRKGRFDHPDFSVAVSINSHGLRDTEYPRERTTGRKRMLVLGDSFAWGFGVEADERFSEVLESRHPGWEVINAGVSGYGTDQEYLYLMEDGLSYEPDVVVLLFFQNDFDNNARGEEYWYYKPFFVREDNTLKLQNVPVPASSALQRCDRFFFGKTHLLHQVYRVSLRYLLQLFDSVNSSLPNTAPPDPVPVTDGILAMMNRLASDHGARFILCSVPMDDHLRHSLGTITDRYEIPFFPLDSAFQAADQPVAFPSDEHWNVIGHRVAADAIERFMVSQSILSPGN